METKWLLGCGAALLAFAAPALAVDGVREINQTCAETTGCFTGDTMGFPVTITLSGSYRLTSNLLIASTGTDVISVATKDVSLDLNGFVISGITVCSGIPPTCTNPGTGRGVASTGAGVRGLSVRNGMVSQMAGTGLFIGFYGRVEGVNAHGNGGAGIDGVFGGQVLGCIARLNGNGGIVGGAMLIADNIVDQNGGTEPGISTSGYSIVRGNTVLNNNADGIHAGSHALITGNRVSGSNGDGIEAGGGSLVTGNVLDNNDGFGINVYSNVVAFSGNLITASASTLGTVSSLAGNLGGNLCDGTPSCP